MRALLLVAVSISLGACSRGDGPPPVPPAPERVPAEISGSVLDPGGRPLPGAKVTATLGTASHVSIADKAGQYKFDRLQITIKETAELFVELAGRIPARTTLALQQGANVAPPITLQPAAPMGQLRGVVRSKGKPVVGASVKVSPGLASVETGDDGGFELELPAGPHKITVVAKDYKPHERDINISVGGVNIVNVELQRSK